MDEVRNQHNHQLINRSEATTQCWLLAHDLLTKKRAWVFSLRSPDSLDSPGLQDGIERAVLVLQFPKSGPNCLHVHHVKVQRVHLNSGAGAISFDLWIVFMDREIRIWSEENIRQLETLEAKKTCPLPSTHLSLLPISVFFSIYFPSLFTVPSISPD